MSLLMRSCAFCGYAIGDRDGPDSWGVSFASVSPMHLNKTMPETCDFLLILLH